MKVCYQFIAGSLQLNVMQTLPMKGMQGMYFSSFKKSKAFQNLLKQKITLLGGQRGRNSRFRVCVLSFNFLSNIGNFHVFAFGLKQLKRDSWVFHLHGIFFNHSGHLEPPTFSSDI